jgi:hypothetical protein
MPPRIRRGHEGIVTLDWRPTLSADEAANDSDKTFTVTSEWQWHLYSIWVELASTATVGNRQVEVQIQDSGSDVVMQIQAGVTQAASLTYNYLFATGVADLTSVRDSTYLTTPLPSALVLPESYVVRVWDNNAVDAAADDMVVQMLYGRRRM